MKSLLNAIQIMINAGYTCAHQILDYKVVQGMLNVTVQLIFVQCFQNLGMKIELISYFTDVHDKNST